MREPQEIFDEIDKTIERLQKAREGYLELATAAVNAKARFERAYAKRQVQIKLNPTEEQKKLKTVQDIQSYIMGQEDMFELKVNSSIAEERLKAAKVTTDIDKACLEALRSELSYLKGDI